MIRTLLTAMTGTLLLAGCMLRPMTGLPGSTDLHLLAEVSTGGYSLQAPVTPYSSASIEVLSVQLFTVTDSGAQPVMANGSQVQKDIPGTQLGAPIVLSHLKPDTTYRVKALAYTADGELISTDDARSTTDVVVGNNERPTLATLKVHLINTPFNGQATASAIVITDGQYVASGSVSVTPQ